MQHHQGISYDEQPHVAGFTMVYTAYTINYIQ